MHVSSPLNSGSSAASHWPLWLACAAVVLWAAWGGLFNPSQLNDSWEQLVWAQQLEWGYWKHPPLTTWLMAALQRPLGPSAWWPYVLGGACSVVTLCFTWQLGLRLLPASAMAWVPLLYTLNNGFTRRAQVFNHNSVLVMLIAAVAWRLAVALASGRLRDWLVVGVLAGLSLLTKYQALLPLGLLALLAMYGFWRADGLFETARVVRNWPGLIAASVVALIVTMPHLLWLWQSDFMPMRYASHALGAHESSPWKDAVALFVLQLRNWIPGLLVLAGVVAWHRWRVGPTTGGLRLANPWWAALIGGPVLALLALAAMGVNLQSHWGMQSLQFVVLLLAAWAATRWGAPRTSAWLGWALLQAVGLALIALQMTSRLDTHRSDDRKVDAQQRVRDIQAFATRTCTGKAWLLQAPTHVVGMWLAYGDPKVRPIDADDLSEQSQVHEGAGLAKPGVGVLQLMQRSTAPDASWTLVSQTPQNWPQYRLWGRWQVACQAK